MSNVYSVYARPQTLNLQQLLLWQLTRVPRARMPLLWSRQLQAGSMLTQQVVSTSSLALRLRTGHAEFKIGSLLDYWLEESFPRHSGCFNRHLLTNRPISLNSETAHSLLQQDICHCCGEGTCRRSEINTALNDERSSSSSEPMATLCVQV